MFDQKDKQIAQLQEALIRASKWMQEPDPAGWTPDGQEEFEDDVEFVEYVMELNGLFEEQMDDDFEEGEE